jgi:hypothetical protein
VAQPFFLDKSRVPPELVLVGRGVAYPVSEETHLFGEQNHESVLKVRSATRAIPALPALLRLFGGPKTGEELRMDAAPESVSSVQPHACYSANDTAANPGRTDA